MIQFVYNDIASRAEQHYQSTIDNIVTKKDEELKFEREKTAELIDKNSAQDLTIQGLRVKADDLKTKQDEAFAGKAEFARQMNLALGARDHSVDSIKMVKAVIDQLLVSSG